MGSLVTEYNKNRPNEWINNKDEAKVDIEPSVDADAYKKIRDFLTKSGGKDWKEFMKKFEEEEVKDTDLCNLNDGDLKELISKSGWSLGRFDKFLSINGWGICKSQINVILRRKVNDCFVFFVLYFSDFCLLSLCAFDEFLFSQFVASDASR